MSETNLSSGTETSDESSGSGDGDNDDDQIPVISDRNPEYHESQQCHEYIDQVLNYISNLVVPFAETSHIVLQVAYYQQSQHQTRTQLIRSQVLQIILVTEWFARFLTLTSPVEKVWFFFN